MKMAPARALPYGHKTMTLTIENNISFFQDRVRVMVFNFTFINIAVISWRSVPQVTENLPSHNVVSSTPRLSGVQTHNVRGDRH